MHAIGEMQYLDEAFEALRANTQVSMTAWDDLRRGMPNWKTMELRYGKRKE